MQLPQDVFITDGFPKLTYVQLSEGTKEQDLLDGLSQKNKTFSTFNNDDIIFSESNTCVSEGFSDVVVKDNYFTLESQTCYDYNIIVNNYLTFRVVGNEIFLHKYGEDYFDKSNKV